MRTPVMNSNSRLNPNRLQGAAWPSAAATGLTTHRVPCRVRFETESDAGRRTLVGETACVSQEALIIRIGAPLPAGSLVEVLYPISKGELAVVDGVVLGARRALTGSFEVRIAVRG